MMTNFDEKDEVFPVYLINLAKPHLLTTFQKFLYRQLLLQELPPPNDANYQDKTKLRHCQWSPDGEDLPYQVTLNDQKYLVELSHNVYMRLSGEAEHAKLPTDVCYDAKDNGELGKLGSGAQGRVNKIVSTTKLCDSEGITILNANRPHAMKSFFFNKRNITDISKRLDSFSNNVLNEKELLATIYQDVHHPIQNFSRKYQTVKSYFVMPEFPGKSLEKWLNLIEHISFEKFATVYAENTILERLQVLLAITKIVGIYHSLDILHRDIKFENIHYDEVTRIAYLYDTGISVHINDEDRLKVFCGTWPYIAPELYLKKLASFKSDIYSLGSIFSIVIPKHFLKTLFVKKQITSLEYAKLLDCFCEAKAENPDHRPTIDEIYKTIQEVILAYIERNNVTVSNNDVNTFPKLNENAQYNFFNLTHSNMNSIKKVGGYLSARCKSLASTYFFASNPPEKKILGLMQSHQLLLQSVETLNILDDSANSADSFVPRC